MASSCNEGYIPFTVINKINERTMTKAKSNA